MAVAEHCKRVNAAVVLEWPKNCEYWNEPAVREFLERLNFSYTEFDGCMYGLVSRFTGVVTLPIRHPWRMAYINCDIGKYLNKVCDNKSSTCSMFGIGRTLLKGIHTDDLGCDKPMFQEHAS